MNSEERLEKAGMSGEGAESAGAETGTAVQQEQELGHAPGQSNKRGVTGFVETESASGEGIGKEEGLTKGEGEAFSRDGIDRAGGIADQSDSRACDVREAAGEGEAAAFGGERFRVAEEAVQGR
jgi:hypothetical protein